MHQAKSIQEVISNLDELIAWSKLNQSRVSYFAVLYRRMTIAVQQGESFENANGMTHLDINFTNHYFAAWQAFY